MSFLSDLIERGKSFLGIEHKPTATQAIDADSFDRDDFKRVRHEVPVINSMIEELSVKYDYVEPFVEDIFQAAFKADPKMIDRGEMVPTHVPNHTMVGELTETTQFQQLQTATKGDQYGAAMALLSMKTAITECQTHMQEAKKKAEEEAAAREEAEKAAQAAQDALDQASMGPEPDPNGPPTQGQQDAAAAVDAAEQAAAAAQAAQAAAQSASESAAAGMRAAMKAAAAQAAQEAEEEAGLMSAFGVGDGDLQKMTFEERRELAQKLRNNRLAAFYKLLGQFRMVQASESRRKVMHAADEVVGVVLGDDLTRMIPSELLNLASPELEVDFWMRYADRALLCYDVRGKEKLSQGAVICVVDESGSMGATDVQGGTREAWSKALSLALADQARQKGRDFYYIGFSSSGQQVVFKFPGGKPDSITQVIDMTEHFWSGGTAYEKPLNMALEIMENDFTNSDKPKPDVVFMTDDEYGEFDPEFLSNWNRVKDKTSMRCYGISIGCSYSGALETISDNVRKIDEMTSDPRVMADVFRSV